MSLAGGLLNLLAPVLSGPVPPFFDEAVYGTRTLELRDAILNTDIQRFVTALTNPTLHPPFAQLTGVPLATLIADAPLAIRVTHWLWIAALGFSVAMLACRMGLTKGSWTLSILFLFTSPLLLSRGWIFGTDIPLACMVTITLWKLTGRPFGSWWGSIWLGLVMGFGLLTKESYPLFVLFPSLLVFARETLAQRTKGAIAMVAARAVLSAVLAALVASPWYLPNLRWLLAWVPGAYRSAGSARIFGTQETLSWQEIGVWLGRAFWSEGLPPWTTLLGLYGVYDLVRRWGQVANRWLWTVLASSAVPALAIWLTSTSKSVRYVLPVLVIVCLVAGLGAGRLAARLPLGRVAAAAAALFSLILALGAYWAALFIPGQHTSLTGIASWSGIQVRNPWTVGGPPGNWHAVEILEAITRDASAKNLPQADVVVLSRYPMVSDNAYRFVVAWKKLPLSVGATSLRGWLPLTKQARDADYVVVKIGGSQGELDGRVDFPRLWRLLGEGFSHTELAAFPLPDGSELVAFRRDARWYLGESGNAVYRLYEALGDAQVLEQPVGTRREDVLRTVSDVDVKGQKVPGLFQHPPGKITFELRLPNRSSIQFRTGLGFMPGAVGRSDGVRFRAILHHHGGEEVLLDALVLDNSGIESQARFDLSRYAGESVELTLETEGGPAGDTRYDWAVWVEPAIYATDK